MSRASSLMKCPQSWFFSGGPDIMVSQTGSDTRGIVYRLQMVVLHTDTHTQRQKSFCQQLKQRAFQLHRAAPAGKDLSAYLTSGNVMQPGNMGRSPEFNTLGDQEKTE